LLFSFGIYIFCKNVRIPFWKFIGGGQKKGTFYLRMSKIISTFAADLIISSSKKAKNEPKNN